MYNDMPSLLDPNDTPDMYETDPVTGAIISRSRSQSQSRSRRPSFTHNRRRSSGSFAGVPSSPLYGYTNAGYFSTSPYLSPSNLPSPQLVPHSWVNAYYDLYGDRPAVSNHVYELSPRRRAVQLPSPNASPYYNVIPLPVFADEPKYSDPRETWASRIKNWIGGESRSDPHSYLKREIFVNSLLDCKDGSLYWNMAYPPHTITSRRVPTQGKPAFDPPLTSCRIVSPSMPWIFEISTHRNEDCITVLSLLADIYNCLKRPIDRQFYDELPIGFKVMVDDSYRYRCMSIPDEDASKEAFKKGIKRIDYLLGKRLFAGLHQVKDMYQTFEIKFAAD